MTGYIIHINLDKKLFAVSSTSKGKCIVIESNDIKLLSVGDTISFDKQHDCTYFYHGKTERISGSVIYIDVESGNVKSYCS